MFFSLLDSFYLLFFGVSLLLLRFIIPRFSRYEDIPSVTEYLSLQGIEEGVMGSELSDMIFVNNRTCFS